MFIVGSSRRGLCLGALVLSAVLACAPPSAHYGTPRPSSSRSLIKIAEIEAQGARFATAYDVVRALRPNMLWSHEVVRAPQSRMPASRSTRGIRVYLDGLPYGGLETLSMIPASSVFEMRWLSPADATTLYGTGNTAGAIYVTSRTGRR